VDNQQQVLRADGPAAKDAREDGDAPTGHLYNGARDREVSEGPVETTVGAAASRRNRLLAVALGVATPDAALAELPRVARDADIVELRLDYVSQPYDITELLEASPVPVIVTNRPAREGGRSIADEPERLAVLRRAAELGAAYVDVEWDAATRDRVAELQAAGARVIVSRHSFTEMPASLGDWVKPAIDVGADVVKVVGMARDPCDALQVYRVLDQADRPTIAIAMGEAGLASRILALRWDSCFLTFCAPESVGGTAPGQISIGDMRALYQGDRLRPTTRIIGILSDRIERDLAARLNRAIVARGLDAVAVPVPVAADPDRVVIGYREVPVSRWLVCDAEFQREVARAMDRLAPMVAHVGRVDLVVDDVGELVGEWIGGDDRSDRWVDAAVGTGLTP
jgi:3-dehydroquinate dehydratase/shikimate dehydrogenase